MKDHLITVGVIAGFILLVTLLILIGSVFPTIFLVVLLTGMAVLFYRTIFELVRDWRKYK